MKVLILGHKGMLGHMVAMYLRSKDVEVVTINTRWPMSQQEMLSFDGDFIINCIGAIPQRTKTFDINWQLPIWLDLHAPCRVIHPGTDCEMDDDVYGISKNVAGDYIRNLSKQTKSIKTSIIGPEMFGNASLMEWFLDQEGEVFGYTKAYWNGNTTLEWSKQCYKIMNEWPAIDEIIISSHPVSKFELLSTIKQIFNKDIVIKEKGLGSDKCLQGMIHTGTIEKQLKELKEFYYE